MDTLEKETVCEQCGTDKKPLYFDLLGKLICDPCYFKNKERGDYDEDKWSVVVIDHDQE